MYGLGLMNTGKREEAKEHFTKALVEAKKLTVQQWGLSYPGNDPASWQEGLDSFVEAISANLDLVRQ
jgi:soluble cytochrome b562